MARMLLERIVDPTFVGCAHIANKAESPHTKESNNKKRTTRLSSSERGYCVSVLLGLPWRFVLREHPFGSLRV